MPAARAILACIVVLVVLVVLAVVRAKCGGLGPPDIAGVIGVVGVASLAGVAYLIDPTDAETGVIGANTSPKTVSGGRGASAGIFAKLRARGAPAADARRRLDTFLRAVGRGFREGGRLALAGPPGDAATLAAMRRAWSARVPRAPRAPDRHTKRASGRVDELSAVRGWDRVLAAARADPPLKYLDIGCAEGHITVAVAAALGVAPERAFACDITPQPSDPRFEFRVADGNSLPFGDAEFGLETMFMSAHHFTDAPRMFAEAFRVAAPGGFLALREHGRADPGAELYYDLVHAFYETVARDEKTPEQWAGDYAAGFRPQYRGPEAWVAIAAAAGFVLVGKTAPAPDLFDTIYAIFRKP